MAKKFILCLLAAALVLFTQLGNLRDLIRSTHMDCEELIYDALWEERDSIALAAYRLTPEELGDHWNHVIYDSAELFYVSDRYEYKAIGDLVLSVSPGYVATGNQLDTARTLYNEALDTILHHQYSHHPVELSDLFQHHISGIQNYQCGSFCRKLNIHCHL